MRTPIFYCALLVICAATSSLLAQQPQTGNIAGQVRITNSGFPPSRIYVSLEGRGTPVASTYADNEGRFFFGDLVANPYRVVITEDGYEPVVETVVVDPVVIRTSVVNIRLIPKKASEATHGDAKPSGGNPHMVDTSDYTQFPKKAIKAYEEGLKAESKGKADEAIRQYQKAVSIAPEFYPARNNLGIMYLAKGDTRAAHDEFQRVIADNQSDASGYFNMSNLLLLTQRYTESEQMLQEGLRRQPNSAFGKFMEGALYARTSRPEQAERALRQALQLDPLMSKVYLELVNLYLHQNNTEGAKAELKTFMERFPRDPLVAHAREVLSRLESMAAAP